MEDKHYQLIEQLSFLLDYAKKAHEHYVSDGKKFIFAEILFSTNEKVKNLLMSGILSLPVEKRNDAIELIFHIEVWQSIWKNENSKKQPCWKDEFTFENEINFPKQSVERLLAL